MSTGVAIVGVVWAGFRPVTPEASYKELMYESAGRAYADAGIDPRTDVDSFVTVAEDFHEGTSIFDEYVPDQLGAMQRPVHTITGDGLHGLAAAGVEASRYLHEAGTTHAQCAAVAAKNRRNAVRNPSAAYGAAVSAEQVMASDVLASPLTRLGISEHADGAIVMVL